VVVVYDGTRFQVVSQLNSAGNATFANVSITSALNVGGVATFSAGTAAAPSITTTGDTNTGIFFPAADTIAFTEGGTESFRVNSSGNMGIGTTTPGAKLDVVGTTSDQIRVGSAATEHYRIGRNASDGLLDFYGSQTGFQGYRFGGIDGTWAVINTSGNLGIGTSSPGAKLDVTGTFNGTQAVFGNTSGRGLLIGTALNGGVNEGSSVLNSRGAGNGQFLFQTDGTTRMTLTDTGNLGIGTSSPAVKLQVKSSAEAFRIEGTTARGSGNIFASFHDPSGRKGYWGYGDSSDNYYISNEMNAAMLFITNAVERARITAAGELLVGTTTSGGYLFRVNDGVSQFTQATSATDCADFWNRATSGDNKFVAFYTETSATSRGSITYNRAGGLVAYNTTSDYRAKDILGPVQDSGAIIDALKVYEGQMKGATQSRPMLVAHEAQEHAPYAVTGEKDAVNEDGTPKYQQMDVSALVPLLLAEIQSLRARVAQLETK
jgi:hypothetical protein